eukprot:scaffold343_cov245-Pinguiococcus_pyrenoidosus.AAC.40
MISCVCLPVGDYALGEGGRGIRELAKWLKSSGSSTTDWRYLPLLMSAIADASCVPLLGSYMSKGDIEEVLRRAREEYLNQDHYWNWPSIKLDEDDLACMIEGAAQEQYSAKLVEKVAKAQTR